MVDSSIVIAPNVKNSQSPKFQYHSMYDCYYYILLLRNRVAAFAYGFPSSISTPKTTYNWFHKLCWLQYVVSNYYVNKGVLEKLHDEVFRSKSMLINLGMLLVVCVSSLIQFTSIPLTFWYREQMWNSMQHFDVVDRIVSLFTFFFLKLHMRVS